jgi:Mn-dependent DtxR family transcriptional regulator
MKRQLSDIHLLKLIEREGPITQAALQLRLDVAEGTIMRRMKRLAEIAPIEYVSGWRLKLKAGGNPIATQKMKTTSPPRLSSKSKQREIQK